jgi:hypothetical protein
MVSRIRGFFFYMVTSVAAIFLFIAMVVVHPLVLLFDRYRRRTQHYIAKIWATLTISMFYNLEVEGMENLPPNSSPAVYVANHQSFLDIYTLLTLGRCFKFISKTSIFMFPIIGWAMYLLGVIPLRRMDSRSQLVWPQPHPFLFQQTLTFRLGIEQKCWIIRATGKVILGQFILHILFVNTTPESYVKWRVMFYTFRLMLKKIEPHKLVFYMCFKHSLKCFKNITKKFACTCWHFMCSQSGCMKNRHFVRRV